MSAVAQEEIRGYIQTELMEGGGEDLTDTTALLELGILDSFSMLKLVEWLENRFSIQVDSGDVTAENFATIESIVGLVDRYLSN